MEEDWPDREEEFAQLLHAVRIVTHSRRESSELCNSPYCNTLPTGLQVCQLCTAVSQLAAARRDTVVRLLAGAEFLDSVWAGCRLGRVAGTGVSNADVVAKTSPLFSVTWLC